MTEERVPAPPGMWPYLSGFDKYTQEIPIYVEKPFTQKQIDEIVSILDDARTNRPLSSLVRTGVNGDQEEFYSEDRFDPRIIPHMSRMIIEFECPKEAEAIMDSYVKPLYKEEIKLGHYSYLDYNPKYGDGKYVPSLPPHIDGANTLVTFNYCLDTNIDWDIYVDNKRYELKKGDALLFSAINQVHWRPKRKWKEGDFCEILTFDYSPPDDWRFTNGPSPLDERFQPEFVKQYFKDLTTKIEYTSAWDMYNRLGLEIGIPVEVNGVMDE